jgi:NADPH:quinone reductase
MTLTVRMQKIGGPEVLIAESVDVPPPAAGEVQLRQTVAGVNFVDIYHRTGLYPLPAYPAALGVEGAGVVQAVGSGVIAVKPGDRVGYAGLPAGSYAQVRNLPEARIVKLPEHISDVIAGSTLLRGLTAHMLVHKVFQVRKGHRVLVHAAAGGLGQLLCRWSKLLGAHVIATVGSEHKVSLAQQAGADNVVLHTSSDWPRAIRDHLDGDGVDLAVDGIGGETLGKTIGCVRPFGVVASMGQVAGSIPDVPVTDLGPVRSISLSRPSVIAYTNNPTLYKPAADDLFQLLGIRPTNPVGAEYPLQEAARAQADLAAGRTTGSVILRC